MLTNTANSKVKYSKIYPKGKKQTSKTKGYKNFIKSETYWNYKWLIQIKNNST